MGRFARYLRKNIVYYIVALLAMFVAIGLDMINPRLMKVIIDDVIGKGRMDALKPALIGLLIISISRAVLGYTKEYLFDLGSSKLVLDLRKDLFDHIQSLSFSFFDGMNTGELMSRIKEDADNVWQASAFGIMLFIEQVIYFVTASVFLFKLNWKLTAISLVTMPFIAWIAFLLEKHIGVTYGKLSDQGVVLNTTAQENIAGVRLVKAFGREKHEIRKFLKQNRQNYRLGLEQGTIISRYYPVIEMLSNLVVVLVTVGGGLLAIKDQMTVGTLVAFSQYIFMIIWPMRMIGWLTNILSRCRASMKKIENIFMEEPAVKSSENAITPENIQGHVVFDKVSLKFGETEVLKEVDIDAKPGSTIAIMGLTGSGKSSIINLMGRYYDCTSGNIYIDGISIKDLDLKALRRGISVVMQDTFLFSDTIKENIKFGNPDVSDEDFMAAAKDARVDDFVMKMPEGYETVIGERGIGLSGGQKQRISIARALVKASPVLILDDSTSALDVETEYEIQKSLGHRKGMTKFIIAHRISAVKNADQILIVDDGEIVERGTHSELMELRGRYYETCCEQFQGFAEIEEEVV